MKRKKRISLAAALVGAAVTAILFPMALLAVWVFTERWAWPDLFPQVFSLRALGEVLGRRRELASVFFSSILISSAVGALAVVIGTMTSRALVFYRFRGRRLIYFGTILPFMVPATVFAMGIQMTFIRLGLNNTVVGVIAAHLVCSLPYSVRIIIEGMEAAGVKLEEQARVLGATAWTAFWRVTFPILAPVLLAAMSMSYIVSFSQYFLTLLIGGGQVRTFTIVMVPYLQSGNRNMASVYSAVFLLVTLCVFAVFEWIAGRINREEGSFYS